VARPRAPRGRAVAPPAAIAVIAIVAAAGVVRLSNRYRPASGQSGPGAAVCGKIPP
jgi:hypothetical protein